MGAERNGRATVIREKVGFLSERRSFTDAPAAARVDAAGVHGDPGVGAAFRADRHSGRVEPRDGHADRARRDERAPAPDGCC